MLRSGAPPHHSVLGPRRTLACHSATATCTVSPQSGHSSELASSLPVESCVSFVLLLLFWPSVLRSLLRKISFSPAMFMSLLTADLNWTASLPQTPHSSSLPPPSVFSLPFLSLLPLSLRYWGKDGTQRLHTNLHSQPFYFTFFWEGFLLSYWVT